VKLLPRLRTPGFLKATSTRGQLTLQYTLVFSTMLVLAAGLLYGTFRVIVYWDIDNELQDEAARMAKCIKFELGVPQLTCANNAGGGDDTPDLNTIWRVSQIADSQGTVLKKSAELTMIGVSLEPQELQKILAERSDFYSYPGGRRGEEVRFANAIIPGPEGKPYLLQVGTRQKPINEALDTFPWLMLALMLPVVVISAVGGSIMAKRTLKPVSDMTQAARSITASNLSQRLPTRGRGDELDALAETFNAMFGRLEESFTNLKEFSANVSHELRTPLQSMQGETELALISQAPLAECRRVMESNLEEIDRLTRMIRNLLVLAQADAGEVKPRFEAMDLNELVRDLVEQMQMVAAMKNIEVTARTANPAPVLGDSLRLRQLTINLIDNAIKYTPSGGRIEVRVERQQRQALLRVRDTGIGIGAEDLPHIFERFYRADKSRSRDGGTDGCGLGLPITKWIAELHHGSIRVTSAAGQGTEFTVVLPLIEHPELDGAKVPARNDRVAV
jgi:heavy metal sensor kinase